MDQEHPKQNQTERSIQDYLSLGYLFLLALGIISDSVQYGFIGVNIISYSNVLDILLSPLVHLTKSIFLPIAIGLSILVAYIYGKYIPTFQKNHEHRKWYQRLNKSLHQETEVKEFHLVSFIQTIIPLMVFGMYIGLGIGGGSKISHRIKTGDFKMTHQLQFRDGEVLDVYRIGHNSGFIFYVTEGNDKVSISPIQDNIRKIDKLGVEKE